MRSSRYLAPLTCGTDRGLCAARASALQQSAAPGVKRPAWVTPNRSSRSQRRRSLGTVRRQQPNTPGPQRHSSTSYQHLAVDVRRTNAALACAKQEETPSSASTHLSCTAAHSAIYRTGVAVTPTNRRGPVKIVNFTSHLKAIVHMRA